MTENSVILDKHRGGWTLLVLLVVVAIIALMMAYYLPSVLQMYSPPETEGEEGTKKPTIEYVRDQLAPIDQRNQEVDDFINQQSGAEKEKPGQEGDYEE